MGSAIWADAAAGRAARADPASPVWAGREPGKGRALVAKNEPQARPGQKSPEPPRRAARPAGLPHPGEARYGAHSALEDVLPVAQVCAQRDNGRPLLLPGGRPPVPPDVRLAADGER